VLEANQLLKENLKFIHQLMLTHTVKRKDWGPKKILVGGLLTKGIKYGYKQYRKAGGRSIIEIMKSGIKGSGKRSDAKTDVKFGIKMHGGSKLTARDKSRLR